MFALLKLHITPFQASGITGVSASHVGYFATQPQSTSTSLPVMNEALLLARK